MRTVAERNLAIERRADRLAVLYIIMSFIIYISQAVTVLEMVPLVLNLIEPNTISFFADTEIHMGEG
jgi:hypothetical protein